jgi:predicted transcriptional regulator
VKEARITVRVGNSLFQRVRAIAARYHVNISGVIEDAIVAWCDEFDADPEAAFMEAWHAGNVIEAALVKDLLGNNEDRARAWIREKAKK